MFIFYTNILIYIYIYINVFVCLSMKQYLTSTKLLAEPPSLKDRTITGVPVIQERIHKVCANLFFWGGKEKI